jgi:TonB family protein
MATWQHWEGRVINGRFPLRRYLGGSEHSTVYLTEINGSKAVIKLVSSDDTQAQLSLSRWELASKLSHPHLIRILDTGRWRGDDERDMLFAVMEHADENLAEVLRSRRLTPAEAGEMLIPTLDALNYLHGKGLVHGKIKPANIMAVGDELKLSSDGIRPLGESKESSELGNAYDAPENASRATSPTSDIWSLGMTLVEALTNHLPTWDRANEKDPKLPENMPRPFDDIAKHCLTWDPGRRWSPTEIRECLDAAPVAAKGDVVKQEISAVVELREFPAATAQRSVSSPEARETTVERLGATWKRRGVGFAAAVTITLVMIGAAVRLFRHNSQIPQSTATTSVGQSPESVVQPTMNDSLRTSTTKAGGVHPGAVTHEVLPDVPQKARDTISGTVNVKVKVAVDTSGAVSHAALVSAGPSGYFANQALQAARKWTFTPPRADGNAVPSEWSLRFEFKRNGTKAVPQQTSPSL